MAALQEVGEAELDGLCIAHAPAAKVAEEDLAQVPSGCGSDALLACWARGLDGVDKPACDVCEDLAPLAEAAPRDPYHVLEVGDKEVF